MRNDQGIERIMEADPECLAEMACLKRQWVADHRLTALANFDELVHTTLSDGVNNFLGSGSFSRVYAIDDNRVLKFTRDLTSLQIMQKLRSRSDYFPRIDLLLENQACDKDEDVVYHAAVIERLQEGYPLWIRSVVDGYRGFFRAESPHFAHGRLLQLSFRIAAGEIVIPQADIVPFSAAMHILGEECISWSCVADLRTELNFMMRADGQVVIADPAHPHHLI